MVKATFKEEATHWVLTKLGILRCQKIFVSYQETRSEVSPATYEGDKSNRIITMDLQLIEAGKGEKTWDTFNITPRFSIVLLIWYLNCQSDLKFMYRVFDITVNSPSFESVIKAWTWKDHQNEDARQSLNWHKISNLYEILPKIFKVYHCYNFLWFISCLSACKRGIWGLLFRRLFSI